MIKIENKVVARFRDGSILKGVTHDFHPNKTIFHLSIDNSHDNVRQVDFSQLKAVFFVRSFDGKGNHRTFDDPVVMEKLTKSAGLKLKVTFQDGEQMFGSTQGYAPDRKGFFLVPADPDSNCDRAFIVRESTCEVAPWT
jgi:hypothetical protein